MGKWRPPRLRVVTGVLAVLVIAIGVAGCGNSRSAAAVCRVWDNDGAALHNKYTNDGNQFSGQSSGLAGPLAAIGDLITAPSQLADLFSKMAAVAPNAIEPDFESIASTFKDEQKEEGEALSNPLEALGSGLLNAVESGGAYDRVNAYLSANCGIPGVQAPTGNTGN